MPSLPGSKLTVDPPLPKTIDHADLYFALRHFKGFVQLFFFEHFLLACYEDHDSAAVALANVNSKLAEPIKIRWDSWSKGDPENGPYPDISAPVQSSFVFVPRTFLPDGVIQKLALRYPGFLAGKNLTSGYIFKFKDVHTARGALEDITETTSLLPFFCGPDGKPVRPKDAQDSVEEVGAGAEALGGEGMVGDETVDGDEQPGALSTFWFASIGNELAVVLNFFLSFYGWNRIFCTGSDIVGVECATQSAAARVMKYINENTPAQAWWARLRLPTRSAEPLAEPTEFVHINCRGLRGKKIASRRHLTGWLKSYAGFKGYCNVPASKGSGPCIDAQFNTKEDAAAAVNAILSATNFTCMYKTEPKSLCSVACLRPLEKLVDPAGPPPALVDQPMPKASTVPQPLNLPSRPSKTEEVQTTITPVLCIRNLPPGTSPTAINSILSALDGCVGFTVAVSGAVFARFTDDASLGRAARALSAYRRLLGDNGIAPARISISTDLNPSAKISHNLSKLPNEPIQKGFLPLSRVPENPAAYGPNFDLTPYFDGVVRTTMQTEAPQELKDEFQVLCEKVEKIKLSAAPLIKRKKQLETNLPIISYRHGGLEKGLARLDGLGEVKEDGEIVALDKQKIEAIQKLVAGAVGAAAHVA